MQTKLILQDGQTFSGTGFGDLSKVSSGEVVFNTGMVGYPESLTDPSYRGQILVLTYPLIGNYGVPSEKRIEEVIQHFESNEIQIRGLIVSDYSDDFNHHTAIKSLSDWMQEAGIPGISGIDTRQLTQILRDGGSQLGQIVPNGVEPITESKLYDPSKYNLLTEVGVKEPMVYNPGKEKTILAVDGGMKEHILRSLLKRDVTVVRVPWDFDFMNGEYQFDMLFLSNGPGDPEMLADTPIVANIRKAMEQKIPTTGICLGIQLMAIAAGGKTYKLPFGHRGQNQPCVDLETEKCYMTSQNHGYAVDENSLSDEWEVWFRNANDNSVEGIKHKTLPFRSVQFHPEATPGPNDTQYIFDLYLDLI